MMLPLSKGLAMQLVRIVLHVAAAAIGPAAMAAFIAAAPYSGYALVAATLLLAAACSVSAVSAIFLWLDVDEALRQRRRQRAYAEALAAGYRFYSYGEAMLVA